MLKKIFLVATAVASFSFISTSFAGRDVHWWHYPDKYRVDFEEWYPANVKVWDKYYIKHKSRYAKFCTSNPGWTFCVRK
jgi:hypothetical protein